MAERRMFAKTIIDSDAFLDMPPSTQALYFHLNMRADDDGFVNNPRKIQRAVGASEDDLKLLVLKRFVIGFESGVIVIKHWRMHNTLRKDRYCPTQYQEELSRLSIKSNNAYTENDAGNQLATNWQPDGNQLATQVRLGKDRLGKDRLGKDRLGKIDTGSGSFLSCPSSRARAREEAGGNVENPVGNFVSERWVELSPEALQEGARLTGKLFHRWCGRNYTQEDECRVAACVERYGAELVMYAFEQALQNGRPGNWNYINGILRNLESRGIDSLEQAEDFDGER